ncbi:glycosyltransferase family 2 protein [Mycobacterium sp. AZCC_0083]|uniref:glycosyltransferase n=1 Tax=Mycobacterium sp. AZCC_0083 TaxID=2735882 RepID=UPI00182613D1|nr:glycosyltransferase [Mycobacterium sp. AZCC_0083]MBB5162635.1 glycosyltransferase involved in cell wall biosynthesis [Mycobacterium sp. AZCC_0083]
MNGSVAEVVMTFERAVVVIPAHNESVNLPDTLKSVVTAAACLSMTVSTVVVLDSCDDASIDLAGRFGSDVHFIEVDVRNVGASRAAGFSYARSTAGVDCTDESRTWYATTDADSMVDPDWLIRQTASRADMVLGVVRIVNWHHLPTAAVRRYLSAYRSKRRRDGHGHVHGANMGFRAQAYWRVGGFAALQTGEDVDLVRRFDEHGYHIDRDERLSVTTSARQKGKAPMGFAAHLRGIGLNSEREPA